MGSDHKGRGKTLSRTSLDVLTFVVLGEVETGTIPLEDKDVVEGLVFEEKRFRLLFSRTIQLKETHPSGL